MADEVMLRRSPDVTPASLDVAARTVRAVIATAAPVRMPGPAPDGTPGPWLEALDIDGSEWPETAPLLVDHEMRSRAVVGVVRLVGVRGDGVEAVLELARTALADEMLALIEAGGLRGVSVGCSRLSVSRRQDGVWVTRVRLAEVSLTPVPLDPRAQLRADGLPQSVPPVAGAGGDGATEAEMADREEPAPVADGGVVEAPAMPGNEEARSMAAAVDAGAVAPMPAAVPAAVLEAERARVVGIMELGTRLGVSRAMMDDLVARGVPLVDAREALLTAAAAAEVQRGPRPAVVRVVVDEMDTRRSAIVNALLHRSAPHVHALSEPAREWCGLPLLEVARQYLLARGERVRGMGPGELATRALHTTSDFPLLLAEVANKSLRTAYEESPRTFVQWARRVSIRDFKLRHVVSLGEAPALQPLAEGGEFVHGTLPEGRESYRLATYGAMLSITRQALVNDDLDGFSRVPAAFGAAAARKESDIVYGLLTANAVLSDNVALFHATHGNLVASGAALSLTTLGTGRVMMMRQKGPGGALLSLRPRYLVVPVSLLTTAEQIVGAVIYPAQSSNAVPESMRALAVVADPRLDEASATTWYLAADPAQIDTIEYAYLDGQDGVVVESEPAFTRDGISIRARMDFGAGVIDYRGLCRLVG